MRNWFGRGEAQLELCDPSDSVGPTSILVPPRRITSPSTCDVPMSTIADSPGATMSRRSFFDLVSYEWTLVGTVPTVTLRAARLEYAGSSSPLAGGAGEGSGTRARVWGPGFAGGAAGAGTSITRSSSVVMR